MYLIAAGFTFVSSFDSAEPANQLFFRGKQAGPGAFYQNKTGLAFKAPSLKAIEPATLKAISLESTS